MSRRNNPHKKSYYSISPMFAFDDSNVREKCHDSQLFIVKKGREGLFNGVVLNKLCSGVCSVEILDEDGDLIGIDRKIFFFDAEDDRKTVRVWLNTGYKKEFQYSKKQKRFIVKENIYDINRRLFA